MRRKLALTLFYLVSVLVLLGGLGDLTITELVDVQREFLSGGGAYEISPPAQRSFLALLHAMAGGLIGIGLAALALTHFGIRRGQRWAAVTVVAAIGSAELANTIGMYSLGSPFWMVTAGYLALTAVAALVTFAPTFVSSPSVVKRNGSRIGG